jgi:hypothetical protein
MKIARDKTPTIRATRLFEYPWPGEFALDTVSTVI